MQKIYKAFALLLFPVFCLAQSNFKPGYVVTLKGDTLRGEVDYKEWGHNPTEVRFKNNDGSLNIYTPANTAAFAVTGLDYYQRFVLALSTDEIELSRLSVGLDSTLKTDTAFLRVVTTGQYITLYEYTDNIKRRYIIADTHSNQPHELSYHVFLDPQNTSQIITRDHYKNELIKYAILNGKNDQSFFNEIRQTKYDNDIVKLVDKINGNTGKKTTIKYRSGIRWVVGANVNCAVISYTGATDLARNNQLNKNYFPGITVGLDFLRNANIGKLFLRLEAGFYTGSFTASGYSETNVPSVGRIVYKQTYNQWAFSAGPDIFYNIYNTQQLKAFAAVSFIVRAYNTGNNKSTETDASWANDRLEIASQTTPCYVA